MLGAHIARNGIVALGIFLAGAAWPMFFENAGLITFSAGAAIALGAVYFGTVLTRGTGWNM